MTRENNRLTINIQRPCKTWPAIGPLLRQGAETALKAERKGKAELTLVLADDAFIRDLNRRYRKKDKPTNVLSFPEDDPESRYVGDVVMAYETIARESREQGKPFRHHALHMAIHGVLHLLGHDHEDESEAGRMESLEIRILKRFGVNNPYEH